MEACIGISLHLSACILLATCRRSFLLPDIVEASNIHFHYRYVQLMSTTTVTVMILYKLYLPGALYETATFAVGGVFVSLLEFMVTISFNVKINISRMVQDLQWRTD